MVLVCAGGIRASLSRGFQEWSSDSPHAEMAAGQHRDRPAVTTATSREQGPEHEVAKVLSQTNSACVYPLYPGVVQVPSDPQSESGRLK